MMTSRGDPWFLEPRGFNRLATSREDNQGSFE